MEKRKGPISVADIAAKIPPRPRQPEVTTNTSTWSAKDAYRFITDKEQGPLPIADVQLEVNAAKTDNKAATNRQQSSNKAGIEPATNRQQSGNKIDLFGVAHDKTGNKVGTQPATLSATNRQQSGNKPATNPSFSSLVGLQRAIVIFLYESCKVSRSRATDSLTLEHIASSLKTRSGSVKTTLQRLEAKGCIRRIDFKNGRSGWSKYELPEFVYSEILQHETSNKLTTKWQQTGNKVGTEPATEPTTSPSSSSRSFLIKEESTTTRTAEAFSAIDLTLVQPFGITASVLARCVELYPVLQLEQLECLVYRFAEFAKDPKNRVQNARGFFISLAEQASKGQIPLDHIETPDERLMRLFITRQQEAKARRVDVEQAAQEFECEAWLESLTPEMKLTLIPESQFMKAGTAAHQAMLKRHFTENVWPDRRKQILGSEATP